MVLDAIGPYRIGRKLLATSLGVQYEATHDEITRPLVVLVLGADYTKEPSLLKRLLTEARAADAVDHPGFVPVADRGETADGTVYLVYELPAGETLRQVLKRLRGPMAVERSVHLAKQLAGALAAAHARGLVHRDLQPQHILLTSEPEFVSGERVKLLDFGITNFAERWHATLTAAQCDLIAIVGNPTYMSPEQCSGSGIVDDKTDVYSLGVILYQMLAGRTPFNGEGHGVLLGQHLFKDVPALAQAAPGVPAALAELVERMLIKQRDRRPAMEQVVATLAQLPSAVVAVAPALPTPPRRGLGGQSLGNIVNPFGATGRFSLPDLPGGSPRGRIGRSKVWLAGVALVALLPVGGSVAWRLHRGHANAAGPRPTVEPVRKAATVAPRPREVIPVAPQAPALAPPGTPVRRVRWQLSSEPSGATVVRLEDNQNLGTTPWHLEQLAEPGLQTLRLRKPGYADTRIILDRSESSIREISLLPLSSTLPVVSELKHYPLPSAGASKAVSAHARPVPLVVPPR